MIAHCAVLLFAFQLIFIREYLEDVNEGCETPFHRGGVDQSDEEKQLLKEVGVFALSSHYLAGCWAITESYTSDLPFGFMVSVREFIVPLNILRSFRCTASAPRIQSMGKRNSSNGIGNNV